MCHRAIEEWLNGKVMSNIVKYSVDYQCMSPQYAMPEFLVLFFPVGVRIRQVQVTRGFVDVVVAL